MDRKSQFIGKVTAATTHELKNVLAIIKESIGLMQDIMSLNKAPVANQDKFERTLSRMMHQVTRGVNLSIQLNTFAHVADHDVAEMQITHVINQALFASKRAARLKNVVVECELPQGAIIVNSDPLALQMALFQVLGLIIENVGAGGHIHLKSHGAGKPPIIKIIAEPTDKDRKAIIQKVEASPDWKRLKEWTSEINVRLDIDSDMEGITMVIEKLESDISGSK